MSKRDVILKIFVTPTLKLRKGEEKVTSTTQLNFFLASQYLHQHTTKLEFTMRAPSSLLLLSLLALLVGPSLGFVTQAPASKATASQLNFGPLQKYADKGEYNKVVEGLMLTQGITREQAEKEYDSYLDNPNNYALEKGEAYYKSLGYKSLMDGVIGEAEKEGRGDEVRARIEAFKKKSQLKGLSVIFVFFGLAFYLNLTNPYVPPGQL